MASNRDASKDTIESSIGESFEQVLVNLPVYEDTQLFIKKGMKFTWQKIKDTFAEDFKEDLEDQKVYFSIHQSGLYKVVWRYPSFPSADIIHWTVSHTDPETITLSSASGIELTTFRA